MSTKNDVLFKYGFSAIRRGTNGDESEDREWISINEVSPAAEDSYCIAEDHNNDLPYWAEKYPITRCASVIVIEVVPGMILNVSIPGTQDTKQIIVESMEGTGSWLFEKPWTHDNNSPWITEANDAT